MSVVGRLRSFFRRSSTARRKTSSFTALRFERLESRELLSGFHFDFGPTNSPVAPGYTDVPLVSYTKAQGYGWSSTSGLFATNRTYSDPLKRDFINGHDGTFLLDLPNGTYDVQLTAGDNAIEHDNINVYLEGQLVTSTLTTLIAQFVQPAYRVQVNDGQFTLRMYDNGSRTNPNFALDGLDVNLAAAPTANAGPPLTSPEGSAVTFLATASASTLLSYVWNYGDGFTSSGTLAPTHIYQDNGTYTATLTVTDFWGASATSSTPVTVNSVAPTVNTVTYLGTAAKAINFLATVSDPSSVDMAAGFTYSWNFGDGGTSTAAAPSHSYAATGIYTVTLTVKDKNNAATTVTTTATVDAAPVYQATAGVYALVDPNANILSGVVTNAAVAGVSLRSNWDQIEKSDGVYDWSYLDTQIATASAAGKKASISVQAGVSTPAWVYAAGARAFTFIGANSPATQTLPIPWDTVFLAKWTAFVQAMGAHYAGNTSVTHVKFTGINSTTEELQLPRSTGVVVSNGQTTWTTTNDLANWQAAGYTRQIMEGAWRSLMIVFSRAFPTQQVALEIIPQGFPALDDQGNIIPGQPGDTQIVNDIINQGIAICGSQLIIQNNGLSDSWTSPQVSGVSAQVTTGYQTLWFVTNDNTYRMNGGTPIDPATALRTGINNGTAVHAKFLEIYSLDIVNSALQSVLTTAKTSLATNAVPTAVIANVPTTGHLPEGTSITVGNMVADPTSASVTGLVYAWTVTKNGASYATGTKSTLTFKPNDNGTYVISLTVTDAGGLVSLASIYTLTVDNLAPVATIGGPYSGVHGTAIAFTGNGFDAGSADVATLTYLWTFGDGTTSTTRTASHTYVTAGVYYISLTVTDKDGGTVTVVSTVTVR